jgi:hypothetical protein
MRRMVVLMSLIAVASALLLVSAGYAQSTKVLVVPASSVVAPGEMVTIEVQVRDVVELYAMDIGLTFDPARLEVQDADGDPTNGVQIEPGDFLDPAQGFLVTRNADNITGEARYVLTLMAPAQPKSGSGVLARITFRARSPGSSTLELNALLVSFDSEPIPAAVSGGLITVSGDTSTPLPTPTVTATRTHTPTSTHTPTGAPSPTPTSQAIEEAVLEEAARTLGWPTAVTSQPPLYKIHYVAAAGHSAEAWMQRYDRVEDAQAALLQQRDGLVADGWDIEARLFHGYDAYQANRSLNPGSPVLPMSERRFDFQGSIWLVGAYAFDDTPYNIAPDPETVAEAVYQAGRGYGLFADGVVRVFLPIVVRGYPPPAPSPTPTATKSAAASPTLSPTATGSATPPPTPTATASATPSATPSPTATGSVTPSATPQYVQLVVNPSFETDEAWEILQTDYPAGYSVSRARTGSRSMRLGIDTGHNVFSFSSVQQTVTIPAGAIEAELSFYYFPVGAQTDDDRIYFFVLRASDDAWLQSVFWTETHQAWNLRTFDLLSYAGQPVKLRFGVKNDGFVGTLAVYVDDVELRVVRSE